MTPERPPSIEARPADLTDAEFQELDDLLMDTPGGAVLDAPMLDGFLCGVIVQPALVEPAHWLPYVFDPDGAPLPEPVDTAWQARTTELILRRHAAVLRSIAEDGDFDPAVIEPEDEDGALIGGEGKADADASAADTAVASAPTDRATDADADADDDADVDADEAGDEGPDPWATLDPVSRALAPWVAGFQIAATDFPALIELDDDAVSLALARLFRHLPAEDEPQREINALLDRERPLRDLEEAVADLVEAVVELHDLTGEQRYHVETVRRESPKVGRNDPCPCRSGRKFKHCHGATA